MNQTKVPPIVWLIIIVLVGWIAYMQFAGGMRPGPGPRPQPVDDDMEELAERCTADSLNAYADNFDKAADDLESGRKLKDEQAALAWLANVNKSARESKLKPINEAIERAAKDDRQREIPDLLRAAASGIRRKAGR